MNQFPWQSHFLSNLNDTPDEELSTTRESELGPAGEGLREHYITPLYLDEMTARLPDWSTEHIVSQAKIFRRTLGDYPEVLELLEGELHRRNLNKLRAHIRKSSTPELDTLLEKYGREPDYHEMITTEIEIRGGATHLHDASGET